MISFTCFHCPCGPGLVSRADSLQLTLASCLSDEPLQPESQEGCVDTLPDVSQHFLEHWQRKDTNSSRKIEQPHTQSSAHFYNFSDYCEFSETIFSFQLPILILKLCASYNIEEQSNTSAFKYYYFFNSCILILYECYFIDVFKATHVACHL